MEQFLGPSRIGDATKVHLDFNSQDFERLYESTFSSVDVVVAGRFHIGIAAAATGRPLLLMPLGRKFSWLASASGAKLLGEDTRIRLDALEPPEESFVSGQVALAKVAEARFLEWADNISSLGTGLRAFFGEKND
jgi:hypothetical protein